MAKYRVQIGEKQFKVEINGKDGRAVIDGEPIRIDPSWPANSDHNLSLLLDGRSFDLRIEEGDDHLAVLHAGRRVACTIVDEHLADLQKLASLAEKPKGKTVIKSPMPGLVVKVLVSAGDTVAKGDRLLVIEAMKMENEVKAPCAGKVAQVLVARGDAVTAGKEVVVIE